MNVLWRQTMVPCWRLLLIVTVRSSHAGPRTVYVSLKAFVPPGNGGAVRGERESRNIQDTDRPHDPEMAKNVGFEK